MVRTRHAVNPDAAILHAPGRCADSSLLRSTLLCFRHARNEGVPLTEELSDVDTRDRFDSTDALRGEHVRLNAPFPRMNGARPSGGNIRHAEVAEYVVPAGLHESGGMPVNHSQRLRVGKRDVVRGDANDGTWAIVSDVAMGNPNECVPYFL